MNWSFAKMFYFETSVSIHCIPILVLNWFICWGVEASLETDGTGINFDATCPEKAAEGSPHLQFQEAFLRQYLFLLWFVFVSFVVCICIFCGRYLSFFFSVFFPFMACICHWSVFVSVFVLFCSEFVFFCGLFLSLVVFFISFMVCNCHFSGWYLSLYGLYLSLFGLFLSLLWSVFFTL